MEVPLDLGIPWEQKRRAHLPMVPVVGDQKERCVIETAPRGVRTMIAVAHRRTATPIGVLCPLSAHGTLICADCCVLRAAAYSSWYSV